MEYLDQRADPFHFDDTNHRGLNAATLGKTRGG
jgi:hypothetical protein